MAVTEAVSIAQTIIEQSKITNEDTQQELFLIATQYAGEGREVILQKCKSYLDEVAEEERKERERKGTIHLNDMQGADICLDNFMDLLLARKVLHDAIVDTDKKSKLNLDDTEKNVLILV